MLKNLFLLFCFGCIVSCANNPFRSYKKESDQTLSNIYNGTIESAIYLSGSPDVLYYMENGIYQRMLSRYQTSDNDLNIAQADVDTWVNSWKNSTVGHITSTSTSLLVNDNATDYQLKGYEKTSLSAFRALNHIDLNNWEDARVEIKKMYQVEMALKNYHEVLDEDEKNDLQSLKYNARGGMFYTQIMRQYNLSHKYSQRSLLLKNSYQSAFSHYLAGFVFEALGEDSLARPGYLNALQLNPLNQLSKKSIDNLDANKTHKPGFTNLLVIEEIGHAPQYKSHEIPVNFSYNARNNTPCDNQINVFFPELVADRQARQNYIFNIDGHNQNVELFTDYDLMAARYLHDQIPHLILRNLTSASRNMAMSQAICNANSDGDSSVTSIINLAAMFGSSFLDKVDERSWVLLPSKVYLNRSQLAYGKHTLNIEVMGRAYSKEINLDKPYQILDIRVMGSKVFFMN